MKLIWVASSSRPPVELQVRTVGVVAAVLLAGTLGTALVAAMLIDWRSESETVAELRMQLNERSARIDELEANREAESSAVGRQLSEMQARLLRMEALGSRVVEVADLDAEEFSFGRPPAQGGPLSGSAEPMQWRELRADVDELAWSLRGREQQLEVLEAVLTDREYRRGLVLNRRPITWGWLSSGYGKRVDPITGNEGWHAGVDFAGKAGSDVVAVASGVVVYAGKRSGYGRMVEINHGDGYATRYAHHDELRVAAGEVVKKGQVVGTMGSSGRSTGPHVHFEVLKNGRTLDPAKFTR